MPKYSNISDCYAFSGNCSGLGGCIEGTAYGWLGDYEGSECRCKDYFLSDYDCSPNITFWGVLGPVVSNGYWVLNTIVSVVLFLMASSELFQRIKHKTCNNLNHHLLNFAFVILVLVGLTRTAYWSFFGSVIIDRENLISMSSLSWNPFNFVLYLLFPMVVLSALLIFMIWIDLAASIAYLSDQKDKPIYFRAKILVGVVFVLSALVFIVVLVFNFSFDSLPFDRAIYIQTGLMLFILALLLIISVGVFIAVCVVYRDWGKTPKGIAMQYKNQALIVACICLLVFFFFYGGSLLAGYRRNPARYMLFSAL